MPRAEASCSLPPGAARPHRAGSRRPRRHRHAKAAVAAKPRCPPRPARARLFTPLKTVYRSVALVPPSTMPSRGPPPRCAPSRLPRKSCARIPRGSKAGRSGGRLPARDKVYPSHTPGLCQPAVLPLPAQRGAESRPAPKMVRRDPTPVAYRTARDVRDSGLPPRPRRAPACCQVGRALQSASLLVPERLTGISPTRLDRGNEKPRALRPRA